MICIYLCDIPNNPIFFLHDRYTEFFECLIWFPKGLLQLFLLPGFLEFFENTPKMPFFSTFNTVWTCDKSDHFYTFCISIQEFFNNFPELQKNSRNQK